MGLPYTDAWLGRVRNWLTYRLVDHVVFKSVNRAYARLARRHGWPLRPFRPSLPPNRPTAAQVHTAVRALLDQPRYRNRARQLAAELAKHDAASEAADLLEQLARTRQPAS